MSANMDHEIPSPDVLLRQSPSRLQHTSRPARNLTKPRGTASFRVSQTSNQPQPAEATTQNFGIAASKQSKSRNGCITCKKKRVKCDETKPTCSQCERRNVRCEGYKVQYRWRSFEDTTKQTRAEKSKKSQEAGNHNAPATNEYTEPITPPISLYSDDHLPWSPILQSISTDSRREIDEHVLPSFATDQIISSQQLSTPRIDPIHILNSGLTESSIELLPSLSSSPNHSPNPREGDEYFSFSVTSPAPANIERLDSELIAHPGSVEQRTCRFLPYQPASHMNSSPIVAISDNENIDDELDHNRAISRTQQTDSHWRTRNTSPAVSLNSTTSSQSIDLALFTGPYLDPSSPEMLMLRFDKETCGILSIKDGPSENPWRTFIRPLAKESRAVYHAISAMAALHGATTQPQLRIIGMAHMTKSISKLSSEMNQMSLNQILASALALCLSEGWDDKISTGIQHLKGVKSVLNSALAKRSRSLRLGQLSQEEAEPLKFLSNTFVYLDAIARLTSKEADDNIDLDNTVQAVNEVDECEIDPLMGCAVTLFPLLGKVATLVQRVRKTTVNSLRVISEANELREQLLQWEPPDMDLFEQPEDPSSNIRHALQTAEAYRRAILLHLHSAVTELSSEPSHDQAKSTLAMLAATPLSSRTMIVQIFPLLVGSCEMVQPDDRHWVAQRWDAMIKRLRIVSVSSCWKVVKEVWRRRDQWVRTQRPQIPRIVRHHTPSIQAQNPLRGTDTPLEDLEQPFQGCSTFDTSCHLAPRRNLVRLPRRHTDVSLLSGGMEYTVRGQLHWLGVMSDWNWEVFL